MKNFVRQKLPATHKTPSNPALRDWRGQLTAKLGA